VSTLNTMGVVVVASAGNENGPVDAPANCPGVIAVAGLRHTGTKVGYSSLGPEVALGAPGGNCVNVTAGSPCLFSIGTTTNDGLTTAGNNIYTDQITNINVGTSFSAPIVSGIVGLMASANSHLTPAQLLARLQKGATPYPVSSDPSAPQMCPTVNANGECTCTTSTCGAGMANAEGALKEALRPIAVLTAPSPVSSGQNVTLSGVGSTVADGHTVASYLWQVATGTGSLTSTDQITTSLVAPSTGTTDVRFTITDDAGRQDSQDWIFQAVTVTLSPTSASVQAAGGTQTFTGTAQNATTAGVTWSVNGVAGGNTTVGTISAFGVYTAPATVPSPATVTVTDASIQDPGQTASAQVTITAPPTPTTPPAAAPSSGGGGGGGALDLLGLLALVTLGRRFAPKLRAQRTP
jgi:serine protease